MKGILSSRPSPSSVRKISLLLRTSTQSPTRILESVSPHPIGGRLGLRRNRLLPAKNLAKQIKIEILLPHHKKQEHSVCAERNCNFRGKQRNHGESSLADATEQRSRGTSQQACHQRPLNGVPIICVRYSRSVLCPCNQGHDQKNHGNGIPGRNTCWSAP